MTTIRKVSQNQIELARKIVAGQEVIEYKEFTCSRFCWIYLRTQSRMDPSDSLTCRVTPMAKEWAARVLAHLEQRRDKRPTDPSVLLHRKMMRARRAGVTE